VDGPLHDPEIGLSVRKAVYGRTEQEARAMLIEALAARQAGKDDLRSRSRTAAVNPIEATDGVPRGP